MKDIKTYPQWVENSVIELKKAFQIGTFSSFCDEKADFDPADDTQIADIILKNYNNSKKCSCWQCIGIENPYKEDGV